MSSCIRVLYITVFAAIFAIAARAAQTAIDPDVLYRDRENAASARAAADAWAARLAADARDFESAWKLARARYWLGGRGADRDARKRDLERGIAAADLAIAAAPDRPEGHFWRAANMGELAESFGLRQGLKYRGAIRASLQTVLRIDPAFQQGSADRALGRWYFKVPALLGGSRKTSEAHLRKSLTYNPHSTASRFFLAETLFAMDREAEAIAELKALMAAPIDPEWAPEDREFKQKARALLAARQGSDPGQTPFTRRLTVPTRSSQPPAMCHGGADSSGVSHSGAPAAGPRRAAVCSPTAARAVICCREMT